MKPKLIRRIAAVTVVAAGFAVASTGSARMSVGPTEISPPTISGVPFVGRTVTGSPGTWAGPGITYKYQWLRCRADAGDDSSTASCESISGATTSSYIVSQQDLGFRLRFRVWASNKQGKTQATSAPTSVVTTEGGKPANSSAPTLSGSAVVGSTVTTSNGTWVGDPPITFSYRWLRCDADGNACKTISGKTSRAYTVVRADTGARLRARVIAQNSRGQADAFSFPTAVVQDTGGGDEVINLPGGEKSVDAKDVPAQARLRVDVVRFSPSPVTSREQPILVSIRVKDTRGYVIRNATVFIRSTPRLTTGADNGLSAVDGWITYSLQPLSNFPLRNGYNVQFFVKAYRKGDPSLGGIYGTRLVQVPTRG